MNEPIFGTGMNIDLFMGRVRKCIPDITAAVCVCVRLSQQAALPESSVETTVVETDRQRKEREKERERLFFFLPSQHSAKCRAIF